MTTTERQTRTSTTGQTLVVRLAQWVPALSQARSYRRAWLRSDCTAALTILALVVPQGIAYGSLAGVGPEVGLYTAIAAMIGYALFGGSRQLIVGPESGIAILAAAAVAPLAGGGAARYAALIAMLALMVGILSILGGLARLGFAADFLSKPILLGYTDGVVLIIIASQLGKLFGIKTGGDRFFPTIGSLITNLDQTSGLTLSIGLILIVLLLAMRRFIPGVPGALVVVILATVVSTAFDLEKHGVAVVGAIPAGFPRPGIPNVDFKDIYNLLPGALGLTLVAFADGILTARLFARKNGYEIDANREMIGLGVANVAAGILQGFPAGASNSRTIVNDQVGGRTQLVGVIAAALVAIFLIFLSSSLQNLPLVALAAIVIVAASGLAQVGSIVRLYRILPVEAGLAVATLLGVLIFGILYGILLAVALSLLYAIARISRPNSAVLGSIEGVDGFHAIDPEETSETAPGLIAYRFDAPLFFANANYFLDQVRDLVRTADPPLRWFVLNAEGINNADTTADDAARMLHDELEKQGIVLVIARVNYHVYAMFERSGLVERIGSAHFYPSVRTAVDAYVSSHESGDGEQRTAREHLEAVVSEHDGG